MEILINNEPANLIFRPHAYKDKDSIVIKLNESSSVIEIVKNDDIVIYKDIKTDEIVGVIVKNIIDLEKFKEN